MYVSTDAINTSVKQFEIPVYPGQPTTSALPKYEDRYAVNTEKAGKIGIIEVEDMNLRVRSYPSTSAPIVGELANGTKVEIVGTNGGWYKIKFNNSEAWVSGSYLKLEEELPPEPTALNLKALDSTLTQLTEVEGVPTQDGTMSKQDDDTSINSTTESIDEVTP